MKKYEPSAGLLDQTFQTLLLRRDLLRDKSRELVQSYPSPGFGAFDENEHRDQCVKHDETRMAVQAQLELVIELLRPYEEEARQHHEFWEKRACDAMMRL